MKSIYLQFHGLAFFPVSNPNRDREGQPKQMMISNSLRGRISSACLKRTWRVSDMFLEEFGALGETHLGMRTKELGGLVYYRLIEGGLSEAKAEQWTLVLAAVFGATKKQENGKDEDDDEEGEKDEEGGEDGGGNKNHLKNETLFFISPEEKKALFAYVDRIIAEKLEPPNVKGKDQMEKAASKLRPQILRHESQAVDVNLFGRMFAPDKSYNVEACCQVAHGFTVGTLEPEDDFISGVDDIRFSGDSLDRGSGHLGSATLIGGIFYYHVTINVTRLRSQLKDEKLASRVCSKLIEVICTQFPKAKGNSCAQQSVMFYGRLERGEKAPRNLALAFNDPITQKTGGMKAAIAQIRNTAAAIDKVYGSRYQKGAEFDTTGDGVGSLQALLDLAGEA